MINSSTATIIITKYSYCVAISIFLINVASILFCRILLIVAPTRSRWCKSRAGRSYLFERIMFGADGIETVQQIFVQTFCSTDTESVPKWSLLQFYTDGRKIEKCVRYWSKEFKMTERTSMLRQLCSVQHFRKGCRPSASEKTYLENRRIKILVLSTGMQTSIRKVDTFVHKKLRDTIRYSR